MTRNNHNTKNSLYRPKITTKTYNTIGRYCRFIKQFTDDNDWGHGKQHRWSWVEMEKFMEDGSTSHTLKTTYEYTLIFIKGKYFGQGNEKRKIESIDDIFLINKCSPDYPALLDTWNTTGKLTFKRKRLLCLEHHLLAAQQQCKNSYLFYTCSPHKEYNLFAVMLIK